MKVERRSYPRDMLLVHDRKYTVLVSTHHHQITVSIDDAEKGCLMNEWMSLPEFVSLLMSRAKETT